MNPRGHGNHLMTRIKVRTFRRPPEVNPEHHPCPAIAGALTCDTEAWGQVVVRSLVWCPGRFHAPMGMSKRFTRPDRDIEDFSKIDLMFFLSIRTTQLAAAHNLLE